MIIRPLSALTTMVWADAVSTCSGIVFPLKTKAPLAPSTLIFDQTAREAWPAGLIVIFSPPKTTESLAETVESLAARARVLSAFRLVFFVATAIALYPLRVVLLAPQIKDCMLSPCTWPLFVAIKNAPEEVFTLFVLPIIEALFCSVFFASPPARSEVGAETTVPLETLSLTIESISLLSFLSRKKTAFRSENKSWLVESISSAPFCWANTPRAKSQTPPSAPKAQNLACFDSFILF